jgi:four helix bundle protein
MEDRVFVGYQKLIAWQKADELARLVYKVTISFPKEELFGVTSQIRRAVLSVPLNIVEGYGRNNKNEFHRFLSISLGSLAETGYLLDFIFNIGLLKEKDYKECISLKEEGQIIWKLYKSLE